MAGQESGEQDSHKGTASQAAKMKMAIYGVMGRIIQMQKGQR